MFRRILVALAAFLFIVLPPEIWAQTTGSIAGTITDSTEALVPGAKVTVTNMATNDTRKTVSTGQGVFNVSGLVDGDYSVKIEAKGFKAWEISGIHVLPGDRKSISGITLEVGTDTEVVEISSSAAQVQVTDSGDRVALLNSEQVTNLGLEGRDVTELIRTLPGFANTGGGLSNKTYDATRTGIEGGSAMTSFSSQGLQNSSISGSGGSDLISDGARVIDPGCNCSSTQTINADMQSEVKVTTSAFSAVSSHGPVVVEAIGKSGAAKFYGSLYFYYRNSVLNANDYNLNQIGQSRYPTRYAYPGGNIGGPVVIPGTSFNKQKKLVFFAGYEQYFQKVPDSYTGGILKGNLPTISERKGLLDPALGDNAMNCGVLSQAASTASTASFRCGAISNLMVNGNMVSLDNSNVSSVIGPAAQAYLSQTPLPNSTPTVAQPYNYIQQMGNYDNGFIAHARIDYAFDDNTKLYVTYNRQNDHWGLPVTQYFNLANAAPYGVGAEYNDVSNTLSGSLVKVINPQLINEANATFVYANLPITYNSGENFTKTKMKFGYDNLGADNPYLPYLTNFVGAGWGFPSIGGPDISGYYSKKTTPSASDTFTLLAGKHSFKTGISWQDVDQKQLNYGFFSGPNGGLADSIEAIFSSSYAFADGNLHPIANFLTDGVSSYSTQSNLGVDLGYGTIGAFLQDDWKVTKKLTLNLGLRVDHFGAWTDRSDGGSGVAVFSSQYYLADGGATPTVTSAPGVRTHSQDRDIPKSGRSLPVLFTSPRFGMAYDVFGTGKTVVRGGIGAYYYQDNYNTYAGPLSQGDGSKTCALVNGTWLSPITGTYYSSLSSLNANAHNEIQCSTTNTFSPYQAISAADAEDEKMPYTYTYNFAVSQRTFKDSVLEVAYSGNQTLDLATSLNANVIPMGAYFADTTHTVYQIVNGTSQLQNSFRPMPNYAAVTLTAHKGWSNYNSMQVSWNRMRGALTYGLNYTWSKSMGIANTTDPVNLHNDYGTLGQDRTHVFNSTYGYNVGKRIKSNPLLARLVNDWALTGITTLQSGANIQTNSSQNFGLTGTNSALATPTNPGSTPQYESVNAQYYLGTPDYTLMPTLTCAKPSSGDLSNEYMNAKCFAIPAKMTYNQHYWLPYTRGPMFFTSDATLSKTIGLKDRQSLQFKASAFNFLNHALPGFDTGNNSNMILNVNQGTIITTVASPNGGSVPVGTTTTKYGHRTMEVDLKYSF